MPTNKQNRLFNWAVFIAISVQMAACGSAPEQKSNIKITNGRQIAESEYSSVVYIESEVAEGIASCTATFVNPYQVISAAHCVEGTNAKNPQIFLVKQTLLNGRPQQIRVAKALRWARDPNYNFDDGVNNLDISVISFSSNVAPAVSKITRVVPKAGDLLTIVGYGNSRNYIDSSGQFSGSGAGLKRVGTNKIAGVEEGLIQFIGAPAASRDIPIGTQVLSGSGDSGGPLFINGLLAGVTSGGGYGKNEAGENVFVSQYVDLTSSSSQIILRTSLLPGTL